MMTQEYLHELSELRDHYHVHTDVQQWTTVVALSLATPQIHTFSIKETDKVKGVYAHADIPKETKNA
jgi:hypothetical protein